MAPGRWSRKGHGASPAAGSQPRAGGRFSSTICRWQLQSESCLRPLPGCGSSPGEHRAGLALVLVAVLRSLTGVPHVCHSGQPRPCVGSDPGTLFLPLSSQTPPTFSIVPAPSLCHLPRMPKCPHWSLGFSDTTVGLFLWCRCLALLAPGLPWGCLGTCSVLPSRSRRPISLRIWQLHAHCGPCSCLHKAPGLCRLPLATAGSPLAGGPVQTACPALCRVDVCLTSADLRPQGKAQEGLDV